MAEPDWVILGDAPVDETASEVTRAQQAERIAELKAAEIEAEQAHGCVRMHPRTSAPQVRQEPQTQPQEQLRPQAPSQTKPLSQFEAQPPSQPEQQEPAQSKLMCAKASSSELLREVRHLKSFIDRLLVALMLLATSALYWLLTPSCLSPLITAGTSGWIALLVALLKLGVLSVDGILLLLLNVIVLVPFNALLFVGFYVTYIIRMPIYQLFQFVMIPVMTLGKVVKSPMDATFVEWLRILPDAYNLILPNDPDLKPFDNIDEASQDDAATSIRNASFIKAVNKWVTNNVSKSTLNSLALRLVFSMIMCPTLGWWLVGPSYIPLLKVRSKDNSKGKAASAEHADLADLAGGEDGSGRADGDGGADGAISGQTLPPVALHFPKCRFLKVARNEFGEELGKQKCLNE